MIINFNKRKLAAGLLILLLGCYIGFTIGTAVTIRTIAIITSGFLDKDLIELAIYQYKNNLGNCFPSIFQNETT